MSEAIERGMFGCTAAELKESVEDSITFKVMGAGAVAMSYMSDAQEVMAQGNVEHARQIINCAKFIVDGYLMEPERG